MLNNNPFKPTLSQPLSDQDLANDPKADNFVAGDDGLGERINRRMTLSGIMQPDPIAPNAANAAAEPIKPVAEAQPAAQPAAPQADPIASMTGGIPEPAKPSKAKTHKLGLHKSKHADKSPAPLPTDPFAKAAAIADSQTTAPQLAPAKPKQITISLLTIIFCILFLISTGIAVWFGIDNGKKSSQLADAKAKLSQYGDIKDDKDNATNKTTTQFDALQAKIAELTKQGDDYKSQLDTKQKNIDEQNHKIADLTKQNTDFQTKINTDQNLSKDISSIIKALCAHDNETMGSTGLCQNQQPAQQQQ